MPESDDAHRSFIRPTEAPVFEPTVEEFEDPVAYLSKIRPIAEQSGICKIRPPSTWQPPFAVDIDHFKFTPRIQRLNELEAKTRIKLHFLEKLSKFWELQGVPLKIPLVDKRYLDLFDLHKAVQDNDGLEVVTRDKKWIHVAARLGYQPGKGIVNILRQHYEKLIYPYDVFLLSATPDIKTGHLFDSGAMCTKSKLMHSPGESSYSGVLNESVDSLAIGDSKKVDFTRNSELRKLQFFGAGPKTALPDAQVIFADDNPCVDSSDVKPMRRRTRDKRSLSYLDNLLCQTCMKGGNAEQLLVCDRCNDAYHNDCLISPLQEIPTGEWRCSKCIAQEYHKPMEIYGFEQAKREYTLQTFGEMADQFKLDYFNMPVHTVPCSTVEKEFWRLVNCIDEDVVVEYGADNPSAECGSGFPTEKTKNLFPDDDEYIKSPWNLTNLPLLKQSVLHYINAEISGMKVPWCYVGMCFASFAWHIEDHWNYSINYLHWGEPKTWYGVPGSKAQLLEEVMKRNAPELFEQSPDLLHQLTTIMNPNTLMSSGVPVVRTDQYAGEFVVTFPRAYHSGFNQGYNFAEAVNFSMADWLPVGRACIEHYRSLRRQCVFSHDELVCRMASLPAGSLDLTMSIMVFSDMLTMVEEEKLLRKQLLDEGTIDAEKEAFELLPDDERQCHVCKTTCFLSAVTCGCNESRRVCMHHSHLLCQCLPKQRCLRYRYTLDELLDFLSRLKDSHTDFEIWARRAKQALDAPCGQRLDVDSVRNIIYEARDQKFPSCPLLIKLIDVVNEADKCSAVAHHLLTKKVCTRQRESGDKKYAVKLSIEQFDNFCSEIVTLPCNIKEQSLISDLLAKVQQFQAEVRKEVCADELKLDRLQKLVDWDMSYDIDIPEVSVLRQAIQQTKWLEEANNCVESPGALTLDKLRQMIGNGVDIVSHPSCHSAMSKLQNLLSVCDNLEQKAMHCLNSRSKCRLMILEAILVESKTAPTGMPSIMKLNDAIAAAKSWSTEVDALLKTPGLPCLELVDSLVSRGRQLPVQLDRLPELESQAAAGHAWLDSASREFIIHKSTHPLLHVLSPRTDVDALLSSNNSGLSNVADFTSQTTSMTSLRSAGQNELSAMLRLREQNRAKLEHAGAIFCVCRRRRSGIMVQCQLCCELFHDMCVPYSEPVRQTETSPECESNVSPFLCPLCLRTQRPSFNELLKLLLSLQKLMVWLPEGVAVQCLANRAMSWLEQVRTLMNSEELLAVKRHVSVATQQITSAAQQLKPEVSIKTLHILDELAVEGNLLEVHVQEKDVLYSILRSCRPAVYNQVVFGFPNVLHAENSDVSNARRMNKRKCSLTEKKSGRNPKKRKQRLLEKEDMQSTTSSDNNSEELCAADICLRPSGDEVEWVQCDKCQFWFHFQCIGLSSISEHEEYICSRCKDHQTTTKNDTKDSRSHSPVDSTSHATDTESDVSTDEEDDDDDDTIKDSIDNYIIRSTKVHANPSVSTDDVVLLE